MILITFGTFLIDRNLVTIGDAFAAFLTAEVAMMATFMGLRNAEFIMRSYTIAKRLLNLLERKNTIDVASKEGDKIESDNYELSFNAVKFAYPSCSETLVLDDITFQVKPGTSIAFVGCTGSGKSTITKLIQRHYDPTEGEICLNSRDIKCLNVENYRKLFGLVEQEPVLFSMSIKENVRMGKIDATDAEINSALEQADAMCFIKNFPEGVDTLVGQSGSHLSGGQKQKVCIARAIISNPKILILDEATSAMDAQSEKNIQEVLAKVGKNKTVISIAHRLSTIRHADVIYVLEKGKVIEQGNHEELHQIENGAYKKLCLAQYEMPQQIKNMLLKWRARNKKAVIPSSSMSYTYTSEDHYQVSPDLEPIAEKPKKANVSRWEAVKFWKGTYYLIGIMILIAIFDCVTQRIIQIINSELVKEYDRAASTTLGIKWSTIWILLAVAIGFSLLKFPIFLIPHHLCHYLTYLGIRRIRYAYLRSILKQEINYFDDDDNSAAKLSTRLHITSQKIINMFGERLVLMMQALSNFCSIFILALIYSWQIGLIMAGGALLYFVLAYFMIKLHVKHHRQTNIHNGEENCHTVSFESTSHITTVVGLGRQEYFCKLFEKYRFAFLKMLTQ